MCKMCNTNKNDGLIDSFVTSLLQLVTVRLKVVLHRIKLITELLSHCKHALLDI